MRYFKECNYIWKNLIPERGQADNLQGEMLRQIEKLRYEAQNNGNINWDGNFAFFCDFLTASLCDSDALTREEKDAVSDALQRMKSAGQFALRCQNEDLPEEVLEEAFQEHDGIAYTEDDLYDLVSDAIGAFYLKYQTPIPYEANPEIYR